MIRIKQKNKQKYIFIAFLTFILLSLFVLMSFFYSNKNISTKSEATYTKSIKKTNYFSELENLNDINPVSKKQTGDREKDNLFPFGTKKIAVVIVSFKDRSNNINVSKIAEDYNDIIKKYYLENSFNNLNLETKTFGIYSLPMVWTCDYLGTLKNVVEITDSTINYNNFDIIEVKTPFDRSCGHVAFHDIFQISTQEGVMNKHVIFNFAEDPQLTHIAHEIGHAFGIAHSFSYECKNNSINYQDSCRISEFKGRYDMMGNPKMRLHFGGYFKQYLGWISHDKVKTITKSGKYIIFSLEKKVNGIQVVRIPIPNSKAYYYIENREAIGSDSQLSTEYTKGAIIYIAPDFRDNSTELIDTTPESSNDLLSDFNDAPLAVGKTFYDQINKISITTEKDENNILEVTISIPEIKTTPMKNSISDLRGDFDCKNANFYFSYPRSFFSYNHFSVDISITEDFSSGVYSNFVNSDNSPILVSNSFERWNQFIEGNILYWRIKSFDGVLSQTVKTIVKKCPK